MNYNIAKKNKNNNNDNDNDNDNVCISNCYTENINDTHLALFHPFLGMYKVGDVSNNYCIKKNYTKDLTKFCSKNDHISITLQNALSNPIKPKNYIDVYYGLKNMNDIIKYIRENNLLVRTKSRLLDFTFISYHPNIKFDIDKWIELIKILFIEYELSDINISKIINKIENKYNQHSKYPINLLSKIKKYLDNYI
jgi:hypothetical protein